MNKPVAGSEFRKLGAQIEELRVRAQISPNMTVRVNAGSYYTSRMKLVEFEGGTSPVIQAPATGYKWVVVGITNMGTLFVSSGEIKNRAPELPTIEKNMLPLAAIYLGANSTAITEDMIEDIRPFLASGYHPGDHTILDNCDQPNLHPISSITNLQSELDNRATKADLERFNEKIDETNGTSAAIFTLNNAQTGNPTVSSGIMVSRGSELSVGIRFNEKLNNNTGAWEFTNDGVVWNEMPTALSIDGQLKKASANTDGVTRLSVDPVDPLMPIAAGTNDPRFDQIALKANAEDVYTKDEIDVKLIDVLTKDDAYTKTNIDDMLDGKANINEMYTKAQVDAMLRGKSNIGDSYSKAESDNLLLEKANLDEVYSITESDAKFDEKANKTEVYTKEQVDEIADFKANEEDVYTKDEVDNEISAVNDILAEAIEKYDNYITSNDETVNKKAEKDVVYTKEEIDEKVSSIENFSNELKETFDQYCEENDAKVAAKAESENTYTKHEIDDFVANKVSNEEFDALENNVADISAALNKTLTDVAAAMVTQTEYQKDHRMAMDSINDTKTELDSLSATVETNRQDFDDYVNNNNTKVDSKAAQSDLEALTNVVDNNKLAIETKASEIESEVVNKADKDNVYTKEEVISLLEAKANISEVYRKIDTYTKEMIDGLLEKEADLADVYTRTQADVKFDEIDAKINEKADASAVDISIQEIEDNLDTKAEKSEVYTKDEVSAVLNDKTNKNDFDSLKASVGESVSDGYFVKASNSVRDNEVLLDAAVKSNADAIESKANADAVYTKAEVDAIIANMYTKEQVDQAISDAITNVLEQIRNEINA